MGDPDAAAYILTTQAKGAFLFSSGLAQGLGDAIVGYTVVNPMSSVLKSKFANITATTGVTGATEFTTEGFIGNTLENLGLQDAGIEIAAGEGGFGEGVNAILQSSSASAASAVQTISQVDKFTPEIKQEFTQKVRRFVFCR